MVRAGRDFTDRETDFLATVAPAIASATRLALRSEASGSTPTGHPAIVVIGSRGELRALTPAGQEWRDRLDQIAPGRFMVMMRVMAVGARGAASGGFRARVRGAGGQWAVLQASPLIGKRTTLVIRRNREPWRRDLCLYPGKPKATRCPAA